MPPPLLEVRDLVTGYGRVPVLHGVSLRLEHGVRVGIIGPNGHGKTTLMRAISGLLRPWRGDILLEGASIAQKSPAQILDGGIVHVHQGNTLFPDMSVIENLMLGAYRRQARDKAAATLDAIFVLFPRLAERRRQACRTLSGGERQMVSLGVGLMSQPTILMLDEPTLGLSPKLKEELCNAIARVSQGGLPIILVEQDIAFLKTLTDHFYLLTEGRMQADFAVDDDLDHGKVTEMYFGLA